MRKILKISARWSAVALSLLASQAPLAQGDVDRAVSLPRVKP